VSLTLVPPHSFRSREEVRAAHVLRRRESNLIGSQVVLSVPMMVEQLDLCFLFLFETKYKWSLAAIETIVSCDKYLWCLGSPISSPLGENVMECSRFLPWQTFR